MQHIGLTLPTISWVGCNAIKSDYRFPQLALGVLSKF
jgi:hypothetical protein